MRSIRLLGGFLALGAFTSCGSTADEPAATPTSDPATEATTSVPAATAPAIPATEVPVTTDATNTTAASDDPLEAQAMADLATRLGVDTAAISVVRHDEMSWSDGSLGCPKPGFSYTQVITPGYLIVLSVDGRQYEFHGKQGGTPFYCESPRPLAAGVTDGT